MAHILTYEKAVEVLDKYLQKKTTHSTKDLMQAMMSVCNDATWESVDDEQEFANVCSNFQKYVEVTGRTSIGRKQFEDAWEQGFAISKEDRYIDDIFNVPMGEDVFDLKAKATKILEDHFADTDNSKDAHSLRVENTRLRNRVGELEADLKAANEKLEAIRGLILWG